jgi:hypothetical protein
LESISDYPRAFATYRSYGDFLLAKYDIKAYACVSLSPPQQTSQTNARTGSLSLLPDEETAEHVHHTWRLVSGIALKLVAHRNLAQQHQQTDRASGVDIEGDANYLLVTWKLEAVLALYQVSVMCD